MGKVIGDTIDLASNIYILYPIHETFYLFRISQRGDERLSYKKKDTYVRFSDIRYLPMKNFSILQSWIP